MPRFDRGDRVRSVKHGEGLVEQRYPPIRTYGKRIDTYGVRFPNKKTITICTDDELAPVADPDFKPATEFYKRRNHQEG